MHKGMEQTQKAGCMVYSKENYVMVNVYGRRRMDHARRGMG